jgi:hypothetical protein
MSDVDCSGERDDLSPSEAEEASDGGCSSVVEQLNDRAREASELVEPANKWATGD